MFKSIFSGLLIVALGLAFLSWTKKDDQKFALAEWVQSETGNLNSSYVIKRVGINDLNFNIDEIMNLGQRRIGSKYVLIIQRAVPSHGDNLHWLCPSSGYGWAVYADGTDQNKFLTFNFGYKPSLKGCSPAVSTPMLVDFQKEKNA